MSDTQSVQASDNYQLYGGVHITSTSGLVC